MWPIRHLTGGEIRTTTYTATDSVAIFRGDPVEMVAAGTVDPADATDGVLIVGVAAHYLAAAATTRNIAVYDDPMIVFGIQQVSSGSIAATEIGAQADIATYAAGSTTTGISAVELSATVDGTGDLLRVVGLVDTPGNAWGENADVEVMFNEHAYKGPGNAGI
jgi:hypothetical protein